MILGAMIPGGIPGAMALEGSFFESAIIAIPFQYERSQGGGTVLVDGDGEGRGADRAGERTRKGAARSSRGGSDNQADRGRRRLGLRAVAQKDDRPSRLLRPVVEPACRGQVKPGGMAADFQEHRAKRA